MRKYYGVYGENGLGVCNDYDIAYGKRQYVRGIRIKKFESKEEAVQYSVEGYNSLQDNYVFDLLAKESMLLESSVNWIFYPKDIRAYNNCLKHMVRIVTERNTL